MNINSTIIDDLSSSNKTTNAMDTWFKNLQPKYGFETYVPTHIAQYFKHLMDEDCNFKMKTQKYRREFYIKYLKQNAGLNFLASGTNRMCFTSDWDPDVIVKLAYASGRMNAENEMFVQDKLKPHVSKTFCATPDGIFSLHERVREIGSKEDLLPFADQHFMIMMDFYERGYIIEDVGTKTFRNLGIRPNFGLVLLDYPTVYQVRPGDLKCACGGRIFYDAGFNRLQCHTCGRAFTAASLSNNAVRNYTELAKFNQKQNIIKKTEYDGGVKMKFSLVITDEMENVVEEKKFDTRDYKSAPKPAEAAKEPAPAVVDDTLTGVQIKAKARLVFEDGTIFKNEVRSKKDNRNQKKFDKKPTPKPVPNDEPKAAEAEEPTVLNNIEDTNSIAEFEKMCAAQAAEAEDIVVDVEEVSETKSKIEYDDVIDVDDSDIEAVSDEENNIDTTVASEISSTLSDILTADVVAEINDMLKEESSNDEQLGHSVTVESEKQEKTGESKEPKEASKSKRTCSNGSREKSEQRYEEITLDDGVEESSKYPAKGRGRSGKSARSKKGN